MDYLQTLKNKLYTMIRLVYLNGSTTYNRDYFMVAVTGNEARTNKSGIHEYGTSFKYESLLEMYERDFKEILNAYNIVHKRVNKTHVFELKLPLPGGKK